MKYDMKRRKSNTKVFLTLGLVIALAVGAWLILKGNDSTNAQTTSTQESGPDVSSTPNGVVIGDTADPTFIIFDEQTMTLQLYENGPEAQPTQAEAVTLDTAAADPAFIVIDKQTMTLQLYDIKGQSLLKADIACGRNYGNKQRPGDLRTPEGVFSVEAIQDASSWTHDFKDGKGEIAGAYGHWFIRLRCPGHKGIGIHGTHDPKSIGTRCTEGCIRLLNEKLEELKKKVYPGMVVIILPSNRDVEANKS